MLKGLNRSAILCTLREAISSSRYSKISNERLCGLREKLGEVWFDLKGKVVIDFGCGDGRDAVLMARQHATIIGIDVDEKQLAVARCLAAKYEVLDRCTFVTSTRARADLITCFDTFEHLEDPSAALDLMRSVLKVDGKLIICSGPSWYRRRHAHQLSKLAFLRGMISEGTLGMWCPVRLLTPDLSRTKLGRFPELVRNSGMRVEFLDLAPMQGLPCLINRLTRNFTIEMVRAVLVNENTIMNGAEYSSLKPTNRMERGRR